MEVPPKFSCRGGEGMKGVSERSSHRGNCHFQQDIALMGHLCVCVCVHILPVLITPCLCLLCLWELSYPSSIDRSSAWIKQSALMTTVRLIQEFVLYGRQCPAAGWSVHTFSPDRNNSIWIIMIFCADIYCLQRKNHTHFATSWLTFLVSSEMSQQLWDLKKAAVLCL